jgi:hypothetical protein
MWQEFATTTHGNILSQDECHVRLNKLKDGFNGNIIRMW